MAGKGDLIQGVAAKTQKPKSEVTTVVDAALDEIKNCLEKGESVTLRGFGTFRVTERGERRGRNPRTGEEITIPAGKRVSFRASR